MGDGDRTIVPSAVPSKNAGMPCAPVSKTRRASPSAGTMPLADSVALAQAGRTGSSIFSSLAKPSPRARTTISALPHDSPARRPSLSTASLPAGSSTSPAPSTANGPFARTSTAHFIASSRLLKKTMGTSARSPGARKRG